MRGFLFVVEVYQYFATTGPPKVFAIGAHDSRDVQLTRADQG
jgi:hypothetical protein